LTTENPWLNEIAEHNPYAYKILINTQVAEKKDIQDGDGVWIESASGKIKGQAKLTECIHPETVGIAGTFGHWGKDLTIGKEKGAHFNSLLDSELDRIDLVSTALDCCVKVKLHKQ
jgi:molybdopterin-containing oxidoreductase family molybdopterin binding subunit